MNAQYPEEVVAVKRSNQKNFWCMRVIVSAPFRELPELPARDRTTK
jgi:hypothetical protein